MYDLQCRARVFESLFPCRLPVFRNASMTTPDGVANPNYNATLFQVPPVCRTKEDYRTLSASLRNSIISGSLSNFDKLARQQCPDYCTKMKYWVETTYMTDVEGDTSTRSADPLDFFRQDTQRLSLRIHLASSSVTSMKQYKSYELDQLIGDLGGSWGLFLGASIIGLFGILDSLFEKFLLSKK